MARHWLDRDGKDPHANDSHGIYAKHRYLQPIYERAEVQDILVQAGPQKK